ncbi:DNA-processing protein DprA [Bacillus songklensis]|uniref:DNA-processing protein DprA n=1 Tax=Bacillus songklensis TaxID=1069116 RepID=A0ABV8B094_9BACI
MNDEFKTRLIHLTHCRGVGWKSILKLLKYDPFLQNLYSLSSEKLQHILQLPIYHFNEFKKDLQTIPIQDILNKYTREQIYCISYFDEEYPSLLKTIYDPPWILYAKGNISILEHGKKISVVGTRDPSLYGYQSLQKILMPLLVDDWCIVSGLAIGIDSAAHRLAIESKCKTIAVLGSGFYHIYPKQNEQLAEDISRDHLLLSEYPPHQKPNRWAFPMRNRIISGLTRGTIIVQAKERSGSLITAEQAIQQGREVFAIPGPVLDERSAGTNRLIQQGAKLVLTAEDVLSELHVYVEYDNK